MKKIIILIIIVALIGIGLFLNNALTPTNSPPEFNKENLAQPVQEETNLETYEEDFKTIDESLNNID